ncbi:MAG: hypothetical protein H7230_01765 [Candidatus Parcubacteria bacterium]|nr:hypothetical protein [Candidatus Paceibacterota bacterium]
MSQKHHYQSHLLDDDYPKNPPTPEVSPEIISQTSYKFVFWLVPILVILTLLAYWVTVGQLNSPDPSNATPKPAAVSSSSNSSSDSAKLVASSSAPQAPVTITKNLTIVSNNGLVIPNLKATIDSKDFVAKDNQITIEISSTKTNLPVIITGDGYNTIKADKLDQIASIVQMTVATPKPTEPIAVVPAPVQAPVAQTTAVLANRIAYTSEKDGVSRLYSAKSDGSEAKLLSGDMVVNSGLQTRGSDVWFQTSPNENQMAIYKVDISTGSLSKATQFRPYENKDGNNQQISFDAVSGKRVRILESAFDNPSETFTSRLWVSNVDGSNEKLVRERVYTDGQERVSGWKISPDGNRISYTLYKYDKNNNFVQSRLLVVDINNPNQFRTQWIDNNKDFSVTEMGFSGDSKYHLYTVYNSGDQKSSTFIFDLSNTSFKEVKNLNGGYGQFTADGKAYIFLDVRDSKANLYKINVAEATVTQLTTSGEVAAYNVSGNDIYVKQGKIVYYLGAGDQLIQSKIETNNAGWSGGNQFYGGI